MMDWLGDGGGWTAWWRAAATVGLAYGAGWVAALVVRRLARRLHAGAAAPIADAVAAVVPRRLPQLALLIGVWQATAYWTLPPATQQLIENGVFLIGAASITLAAASLAARAVQAYGAAMAPGLPHSSLTRTIVSGLVITLGALVILNGLGVSITPMLTALGVGGLAVALALQEPLANFFAGVFITLGGQLRVGDYVKLDSGQEGYIADFSWRSTRVRMLANNLVVIPNARLAQSIVVNHQLPTADLAVLVEVGVDYDSDLVRVERVVGEVGRDVMRTVSGGVPDFEPFIRYHTFADSSVNFTVILRAREFTDQYLVKHEFVKRLHARFRDDGIVIPFPIRTLARRTAS